MKTKKEYKYFSIFQHKKEEEYLSMMHRSGWRFIKVTGLGVYHFEAVEGEDYVYQLDYNPKAKDEKAEYIRMFDDCGWEYVQEYAGYSYFRKPKSMMNGDEEIFNDDESRMAMMSRVYKGRVMPLAGILCGCLVPQFILSVINERYGLSVFIGSIIAVYIILFAACAISHHRMKHK